MYLEANFLAHVIEQNYSYDAVYDPHEDVAYIHCHLIREVCISVYRHDRIVKLYDELHRESVKRHCLHQHLQFKDPAEFLRYHGQFEMHMPK